MREKVIICGTGSLSEKIFEYNNRDQLFDIVAFVDDNDDVTNLFCGCPVISYNECKLKYSPNNYKIFVAIGYNRCNSYREEVCKRVLSDGYKLVNYISPNSINWKNSIVGSNIFVGDYVFIGNNCKIHDGVILYEGCTLSHDTEIESYCFVSLRVVFGGHSKIKQNTFIGLNTTIKDNITIGAYNIIGCGTNVITSTENSSVTLGNPGVSKITETLDIRI